MSQLEVDKIIPQSGTTLTIGDSGDTITFADGAVIGIDTNTLYIDSANNRVGIGTTSPDTLLHISQSGGAILRLENPDGIVSDNEIIGKIEFEHQDSGGAGVSAFINAFANGVNGAGNISFGTGAPGGNASEVMRITSQGLLGIGTSSPDSILHLYSNNSGGTPQSRSALIIEDTESNGDSIQFLSVDTGFQNIFFGDASDNDVGRIGYSHTSDSMRFNTNASERMRIDSSGNVLVGKTSTSSAVAGTTLWSGGYLNSTVASDYVARFNRNTTDGDIIQIYKDNSSVGSISTQDGVTINIDGGGERAGIVFVSTAWFPRRNGALVDNTLDLGSGSYRFDDLFATNGTIQTSDQNEKQSIQSLTDSEIAVAQRISKLFKTFKWNSAVEEKGDSARTHTGIIAQDVQQAFSDEGLDASNYALFISSTWWEKEISVDAVAEELDEEGNIVVEGKDAYTYMDTKEEVTEGYTERTRLGIRYPELLSFVSSAFEQRLTNIETRLTALET